LRVSLPYRFDTSYVGGLVSKAAAWLEAILLLALLTMLLAGDWRRALGVLLLVIFVGGFALAIVRRAGGSTGTITASNITVEPATFFGVKSIEPEGRFSIEQFKSICVEWRPRVPAPGVQMSAGTNETIVLLGKEGTPDIEIARLTDESGRAFARELSILLSLPVQERPAPGVHGSRDRA
jgi:hypothetical protein